MSQIDAPMHDPGLMQSNAKLDEIAGLLERLLAAVVGAPRPMPLVLDLSTGAQSGSQHLRLRTIGLIAGGNGAAGALVLTIGARTYTFRLAGTQSIYLPFPLLIERGTDITASTIPSGAFVYLLAEVDGLGDARGRDA